MAKGGKFLQILKLFVIYVDNFCNAITVTHNYTNNSGVIYNYY